VALAAPFLEHGLTFGVVELIFTYVCVCRIREGLGMCVAPPTVRSREQVAVASFF
jgi:hypothetical protein